MAEEQREQLATYINLAPESTADYALLGQGIASATIDFGAQTKDVHYIHEAQGRTRTTSYKQTLPLDIVVDSADEAFAYLDALSDTLPRGASAQTDIVHVKLWRTPVGSEYPAVKLPVEIQFGNLGGDGGDDLMLNVTLNGAGDQVEGTFNPTTLAFTAASA